MVVRSRQGAAGRGAAVLVAADGTLPRSPTIKGPFIVQVLVGDDGWVRNLYVAGRQVHGPLKPGPLRAGVASGVEFHSSRSMGRLARRAGRALGLEIYPVDLVGVVDSVVVDVNPFPGFRGVPRAADLVVGHPLSIVDGESLGDRSRPHSGSVS